MSTTVIADIILQGMPGEVDDIFPQITILEGDEPAVTVSHGQFDGLLFDAMTDSELQPPRMTGNGGGEGIADIVPDGGGYAPSRTDSTVGFDLAAAEAPVADSASNDIIYVTRIDQNVYAGAGDDVVILQAISSGYPNVVIDGGAGRDVFDARNIFVGYNGSVAQIL
ncbi:hypothetical protein [Ruixingdingia sedimenti]|uniref:Uncharacterized protein n=1 Tax=Ruixingdingia sedimenti TaxID=3073604 RepID=A0ABU1FF66_9RHOB|nr:hypothetical protein [Xinfangfangia sp. LG-4]MDR5655548.1 hypothetical protein [Xinfangfangia sp. LG-4]